MIKFKLSNKNYDGEKTTVMLLSEEPYMYLTVHIKGDKTGEAEAKLLEMALEEVFKTVFVDRAMPEAIQKVDEYTAKISEMDNLIGSVNTALEQVRQESAMTQGALLEITSVLNADKEA